MVEQLCRELRRHGVTIWLDREQIQPGQRWQVAIRRAIENGAFFLACFSAACTTRIRSYMNVELTIAIEHLRSMPTDRAWFIPVLFEGGFVPDNPIGGGETLRDIQWVDLTQDWGEGVRRVLSVILPEGTSLRPEPSKPEVQILLMADISGSSALAERLDPEAFFEMMRSIQIKANSLAVKNGGEILTYLGDGFLASFNLANNAVACAVEIQEELRSFGRNEKSLGLRIGLAAGPVHRPPTGEAVGEAANLASRLCSFAEKGQILVAESVHLLGVGRQFQLKERGALVLKGFAEPVHAYQVERAPNVAGSRANQRSGEHRSQEHKS